MPQFLVGLMSLFDPFGKFNSIFDIHCHGPKKLFSLIRFNTKLTQPQIQLTNRLVILNHQLMQHRIHLIFQYPTTSLEFFHIIRHSTIKIFQNICNKLCGNIQLIPRNKIAIITTKFPILPLINSN